MSVPVFVHVKSFKDLKHVVHCFYRLSDAISFVRNFRCNGHFVTCSMRDELLCINTDMFLNQGFTLLDDDFSSPYLRNSPLIQIQIYNTTDFTFFSGRYKSIDMVLDMVRSYPCKGHFVCALFNHHLIGFKSDLTFSGFQYFNRQGKNKTFFI